MPASHSFCHSPHHHHYHLPSVTGGFGLHKAWAKEQRVILTLADSAAAVAVAAALVWKAGAAATTAVVCLGQGHSYNVLKALGWNGAKTMTGGGRGSKGMGGQRW